MNLQELQDEWAKDSLVDDDHLDREAVRIPNLHQKYLKFLMEFKMKLTKQRAEFHQLRRLKIRYYNGELGREELEEHGWEQSDFFINTNNVHIQYVVPEYFTFTLKNLNMSHGF